MKCKIPEISWHNRDPVLSVDIQAKCVEGLVDTYRLASGGTDAHVLIWYLASVGADINLELAADLTRHQRAVNAVKWSPNGELLASGDDESVIFIWKQKTDTDPPNLLDNVTDQDKEVWQTLKVLRGHMEDVYDLSWAPNSQFLISGSVDNTAIIWDVHKGKSTTILGEHKGFVQGVAWDPSNKCVATLSTDRYLRIFDLQTKRVLHRINKATISGPDGHKLQGQRMRLFHDDTLQTFFRRLCFTPDGKLLLTPAGVTDYDGCTQPLNTTYAFSRYLFKQPALILPCPDQYTVAVRCCPLLFKLRSYNADLNPPVIPLPYRMVFAVATRSSVYFYDTQQRQPFAVISNIHYTRLTDITWSSDGRVVVVSSTDGFCSLITFEKDELGELYEKMADVLKATVSDAITTTTMKKSRKPKDNDNQATKRVSMPQLQDASKLSTKENLPTEEESSRSSAGSPKSKSILGAPVKPLLAAEIIIDKEILSSDEKFESPEKKSRPATPISVRRHPRTPNTASTTPSMAVAAQTSEESKHVLQKNTPLSSSVKKSVGANPIAVRRTPRAIIPITPSPAAAAVEEAMDAWPTKMPPSPPEDSTSQTPAESRLPLPTLVVNEVATTADRTEDIRLVYEDTVDDNAPDSSAKTEEKQASPKKSSTNKNDSLDNKVDKVNQISTRKQSESGGTPQNKTPRRVELKTISTPKSKRKLL